ncbi:predicted protein [Naegleria gruberi]|uniref:Predicted protein n=1 Tax=Naegleria gruberi TaxID=5762 RepID=D2W245_NAEGR|nr:uncharacterized protein NAEGRDRAFT_75457 [Naegleria gruberi]EFC36879.1 predicted protein [Naegleria gruberi]|eukprot:XP_002669623.1 predicted protein [Naegleria gruberi strain NEG-M]
MDINSSTKEETPSNGDGTKDKPNCADDNSSNKEEETIRNDTKRNSSSSTKPIIIHQDGESNTPPTIEKSNSPPTTITHSQSSPNIFYPKGNQQVSNNFRHHQQIVFNTPSTTTIFDASHPSNSIELKEVSNSNTTVAIPLHQTNQTNQTNVQSTRNGKYSSLADNSFSSTNMPSPNHSTTVSPNNTKGETKQTLRHRAFSNVKLISPRKRLKQSPSTSSFQTSSDSWDVKENRKELEQLFDFKRRGYSKGGTKDCCFNFWTAIYNTLCPVNRISNILLFIVIIHTLVCIIATSVILYSA